MNHYDTIVVGVGGIGSSALYHLARRGVKALGLDRFSPGHDRGSSHGRTRMIRRAYFEHPDYVPLVEASYKGWADLEKVRGEKLLHETGLLQFGPRDGELIRGVLESAATHNLDVEELTAAEVAQRFPGFRPGEDMVALYEKGAGYLNVEACVTSYAQEAVEAGAELRVGGAVRHWRVSGGKVTVETGTATFTSDNLIVTPGPWANDLLRELCIPFEVRRKALYWFETEGEAYRQEKGCPAYLFDTPEGVFYGFPQVEDLGVKVAEHTGGTRVRDPLSLDRGLDPADQKRVEIFAEEFLPGVGRRCTDHTVCMYTMSPDGHFVVDHHTGNTNVVFAAGLSGHGFKFAPVLGQVLCDMVLDGKTDHPMDFFRASRPALVLTDLD